VRPCRILFVTDSLQLGGAERALVRLGSALVERGHGVTVAGSVGGDLLQEAQRAGLDVRILGNELVKRRVDLRYARALGRLVRQQSFDIVHTHMYASAVAAALGTRGTGLPLVVHEHSEATWRDPSACGVSRAVYQRASAVIAVSEQIRQRLLLVDGVPDAKVLVLPNTPPGPPAAAPAAPLPERGRCLVGVVARLQPEKGVAVFLHAVAQLARRHPDVRFAVVGEGPQLGVLEQLSRRLGLPVTFLGARSDGPELIGYFDLLVVPSFSEGTPLVILEAMAAGTPVVATDVGGIPSQVRDEREAILVPAGDAAAIAGACERIIAHPQLGKDLAAAARARLQGHDRGPGPAVRMGALYDDVLTMARRSNSSGQEQPRPVSEQVG
jgi:glycosyltransferase involved in cell wall biosynthesis